MRSVGFALVVAMVAIVASACVTEEDRDNFAALIEAIEGYDQVDKASGEVSSDGLGIRNDVEVVLQGDATAAEVAEVIDDIDQLKADHDVEGSIKLEITSERARRSGQPSLVLRASSYDGESETPQNLGALFVATLENDLPAQADVTISADGLVAMTAIGDGIDSTTSVIEFIAETPALHIGKAWSIQAPNAVGHLHSGPIDKVVLRRWKALVAPFEDRDDVRLTDLSLNLVGGSTVTIEIATVPEADPRELTFDTEQDRLWPIIRAELDLLSELGPSSHLRFSYSDETLEHANERKAYQLLYVQLGQQIVDDPLNRGWDEAAAAHLGRP